MSKKTSILSILLMGFLIISILAGLASQKPLAPYANSNTLGNLGLNTAA